MKLGVSCGNVNHWHLIRESGYHYAEGYFAGIALAEDAEFQKIREARERAEIDIEAVNGMFTPQFCLIGEEKTPSETICQFAEKGFYRAKVLGAKIAVLGSGRSRRVSDEAQRSRAQEEFLSLLLHLGDIAQKNDMALAIEPLRHAETNFINTVEESAALCRLASHKAVGTLVDFFHFHQNGESLDSLKNAIDVLIHAHIARPDPDRRIPTELDASTCALWAKTLREIGYDKRITLEAVFEEDLKNDLQHALPIMKTFL